VAVTGSSLSTHKERFWNDLPMHLRADRRVLFSVETGSALYHQDNEGNLVEDSEYARTVFPQGCRLTDEQVDALVKLGQEVLHEYFSELKAQPSLLRNELLSHLHAAAQQLPCTVPVTTDVQVVPRVEVRGNGKSVVYVGIPSSDSARYVQHRLQLLGFDMEAKPAGRLCYDILPAGVSKHLVLDWVLQQEASPSSVSGSGRCRAVAVGDRPAGNDVGLTRHEAVPFVSVCEAPDTVPPILRHRAVGHNVRGAAEVLRALVRQAEAGPGELLNVDTAVQEARQAVQLLQVVTA